MRNGSIPNFVFVLALATLVVVCLPCPLSSAATIYWTGDLGNYWDTHSGNSNWSTSSTSNTDYGSSPQTGDSLVFTCAAYTSTNPTNNMVSVQLSKITFNRGGIWVDGHGIELTAGYVVVNIRGTNTTGTNRISAPVTLGTGGIDQAAGGTLWLDGGISTTNLSKTGEGTLKIGNVNTWTGETRVSGGTLLLDRLDTLPASTTLVLFGGTVDFGGYSQHITGLQMDDGTTLNTGSATLTVSGPVELGDAAVLSGRLGLGPGTWFTAGLDDTSTITADLYGSDVVIDAEYNGCVVLAGRAAGIDGSVRVDGGTLRMGDPDALPANHTVTVNSGTLDLDGYNLSVSSLNFGDGFAYVETGTAALSLSGNVTADSEGSYAEINGRLDLGKVLRTFNVANENVHPRLRVNADISGTGGLAKTGVGTLALAGNNTFSGPVMLYNGVLSLESKTALSADHSPTVSGGSFELKDCDITLGGLQITGGQVDTGANVLNLPWMDVTGDVTIGNVRLSSDSQGMLVHGSVDDTVMLDGAISGSGWVRITGGHVVMGSANTYKGGTVVEGGVLDLAFGCPGEGSSSLTLHGGTKLRAQGIDLPNPITTLGPVEIETYSGIQTATLTGPVVIGGTLTKTGPGVLGIANTVTGAGSLSVQEGNLALGDGGDISAVPLNLSDWTECIIESAGPVSLLDLSSSGSNAKIRGGSVTLDNQHDTSFDGCLYSGSFVKRGPGALTLNQSVLASSLRIEEGAVRVGGNSLLNNVSLTLAGGTLDLGANTITKSWLTIESGEVTGGLGWLYVADGGTILADGTGPAEISARINLIGPCTFVVDNGPEDEDLCLSREWYGTGPLIKEGDGLLALTGTESIFTHTQVQLREGTTRIYSAESLDIPTTWTDVCQLLGGTLEAAGSFSLDLYQQVYVGAGSQTIRVAGSDVFTIPSYLTGTGELVKTGSGVLNLSAYNEDFQGSINVLEGTLRLGDLFALPNRSIKVSGTLDVNGNLSQVTQVYMTGGLVVTGSGVLFVSSGVQTTPSGDTSRIEGNLRTPVTGGTLLLTVPDGAADVDLLINAGIRAGLLHKTGVGVVELAGNNQAAGAVVEQGELRVSDGGLNPNGYVELDLGTVLRVVGGAPAVSQLKLHGGAATSDDGVLHLDRVTCAADTGVSSLTGSLHFDGQPALFELGSGASLALSANIEAPSLSMTGPGTLEVTSLTGIAGGISLNTGTLRTMAPDLLADYPVQLTGAALDLNSLTVEVPSLNLTGASVTGGTLNLSGDVTVQSSAMASTIDGHVWLSTNRTFTVASDGELEVNGVVEGGGGLVKAGGGSMVLSVGNLYAGATEITGGAVYIDADDSLGPAPGTPIIDHLRMSNAGRANVDDSFTLHANRGVRLAGSGGSFDVGAGCEFVVAGPVSGDGDLGKTGPGMLVLTGDNSYRGTTSVSGGVLALGSPSALPAGNALSVAGATVDLDGFDAMLSNLTLSSGAVEADAGRLTVGAVSSLATGTSRLEAATELSGTEVVFSVADGAPAIDLEVTGDISGPAGLAKTGSGALQLSGANTYAGVTRIAQGTVLLGGPSALPGGTTIRLEGGVLDTGNQSISSDSLELFGGSIVTGAGTLNLQGDLTKQSASTATISGHVSMGSAERVFDVTGRLDVAASILGAGGLIKQGPGTLGLQAANGYGLSTRIIGGVLELGAGGSLPAGSEVRVEGSASFSVLAGSPAGAVDAASLVLVGSTFSSDSALSLGCDITTEAAGATAVVRGSGSLTFSADCGFLVADGAAATDLSVEARIIGTRVRKQSTGKLVMSGNNTFSEFTSEGSVTFVTAGAWSAGASLTAAAGTVNMSGHDRAVGSVWLTGATVEINGTILTLQNAVTSLASPERSVLAGPVTFAYSGLGFILADGGADVDLQVTGPISGSSWSKWGEGTLEIATGNSYTGDTTVQAGVLVVSGGSIPADSPVNLATGNAGLRLEGDESLRMIKGTGWVDVNGHGLTVGSCDESWVQYGLLRGSGRIDKIGAGTWRIAGSSPSSFTGSTTIEAGTLTLDKSDGVQALGGDITVAGGKLRLSSHGQLDPATTQLTLSLGTLELNGYTNAAASVCLTDQFTLSGAGELTGNFSGAELTRILLTGDLTLGGSGSLNGFRTAGTIEVGSHRLTLPSRGMAVLGQLTSLEGGQIVAPNGITLQTGCNLEGSGSVQGRIVTAPGAVISATGILQLGNALGTAGFAGDGDLWIGNHLVTLWDRNEAVLGCLVTIDGGTLAAPNGLLLPAGNNLVGHGTVLHDMVNDGCVIGEGPSPSDGITFMGMVSGFGYFQGNVTFNGGFSPGHSPEDVELENVRFGADNTLIMELGGLTPGDEYDQLIVSGQAVLDGELQVVLMDDYQPKTGNSFLLIDGGAIDGAFDAVCLPELPSGMNWRLHQTESDLELTATLIGDADGNGVVNAADYIALKRSMGRGSGATLAMGDFDGDTDVDYDDLQLLIVGFGAAGGSSPIPEPGSAILLMFGAAALLRRRAING